MIRNVLSAPFGELFGRPKVWVTESIVPVAVFANVTVIVRLFPPPPVRDIQICAEMPPAGSVTGRCSTGVRTQVTELFLPNVTSGSPAIAGTRDSGVPAVPRR